MALDCISLFLSQRAPGVAAASISPLMKQELPLGSLGGEVLRTPEKEELQERQDELIAMGSRMESLNSAADSLLSSASRLEREVKKETVYWDEVLQIKGCGWSVSRMPREKHTLCVRYGFAEGETRAPPYILPILTSLLAHSSFRDRGVAALRRSEDGSISLDHGHSSRSRRLKLRVIDKGIAISTISSKDMKASQTTGLNHEILDARNSIYDEELFHELNREAQFLRNQDVRCMDNAILIPSDNNHHIEITLDRPADDPSLEKQGVDTSLETIYLAVRLLLSQAHLQNLHDRSQPPPPIREGQRPRPVYPILKPLVELFQHRAHVAAVQQFLSRYSSCFHKAGLTITAETTSPGLPNQLSSATSSDSSLPQRIEAASTLIKAATTTTLTIHILEHSDPLSLDVHTSIAAPNFGSIYRIIRPASSSAHSDPITLSSLQDLELELQSIFVEAIKSHIPHTSPPWRDAEVGVQIVTRYHEQSKVRDSVTVLLESGALSLSLLRNTNLGDQRQTWGWFADTDRVSEALTLREVLTSVGTM